MARRVRYTAQARRHLKQLSASDLRRVRRALVRFANLGAGDIKKVKGRRRRIWRLRAGEWRIFFRYDSDSEAISVAGILHRREAYRGG